MRRWRIVVPALATGGGVSVAIARQSAFIRARTCVTLSKMDARDVSTFLLPAEPRVEPASEADWAAIEALTRTAGLPSAGLAEQFPRAYAVARGAGGVLGVAGLQAFGAFGLLRSVVVRAGHRGAGLGRALVSDRLAAASRAGLEGVYLLTSGAAPWFRNLGFVPALRAAAPRELAESPEFSEACPLSADCLFLPLAASR